MKLLLMGNPNVGKSALFNRLTGVNVVCSNYPGTTVTYCMGSLIHLNKTYSMIDVPGTYTLDSETPADKVAKDMVSEGDVIVNVIDSTNLERSLYLTLQLLDTGKPMIVALNMKDDARHLGIHIDRQKLSKSLGVPVVETVAVTGEGVQELVEKLEDARKAKKGYSKKERYRQAGYIAGKCQHLTAKRHNLLEYLEDATIKPLTGLPIAVLVLALMFYAIVEVGNIVIENVLDPFFYDVYGPVVSNAVQAVFPGGIVRQFLLGEGGNYTESLGVLTTGVYVPLDMVLPFVILFYLSLALLEDSGYLPRLATLSDNIMHKVGLHGSAVIPSILGLGCNVPGMLSMRILETKKQRLISATLTAICIPCLAQSAVIMGLLMPYGAVYPAIVYLTLLSTYIVLGTLMNQGIKGESPEILLEIPPYRLPQMSSVLKKTWIRTKSFLKEAVPYVLVGVGFVNILYLADVMTYIGKVTGPVMNALFGLPPQASLALVVGFLRKDVAVGMLAPLAMSPAQLTIAATILAMYFPCVATFMVLYKELGIRDLIVSMSIMVATTSTVGFILKLLLL